MRDQHNNIKLLPARTLALLAYPPSPPAPTETTIYIITMMMKMTTKEEEEPPLVLVPPPREGRRPLTVSLLDYGAGNVRSVRNAIAACGYGVIDISSPSQISSAEVVVFPGVGSYHSAMTVLRARGYDVALREYLNADRPYLGICLGMQTLFDGSEECDVSDEALPGLGIVPGKVVRFDEDGGKRSVPHIGWNGVIEHQSSPATRYLRGGGRGRGGGGTVVLVVFATFPTVGELW